MIRVFTRTWWKKDLSGKWPDGLEPCAGRKSFLAWVETAQQARNMCERWNKDHKPGRYSRKAEWEKS